MWTHFVLMAYSALLLLKITQHHRNVENCNDFSVYCSCIESSCNSLTLYVEKLR